jgi:hypothetical protein
MDPILDKARAGQNALERLMNHIPGFKGYRERDLRRDADRLQREHLAADLELCKQPLNDLAMSASREGALEAINDIETARKRLDKVIARIRYAERGYSGFFDTVKVDEAMLERVYAFDLSLVEGVGEVRTTALAAAAGHGVRDVIAAVDALDASLAEREAILSGVK